MYDEAQEIFDYLPIRKNKAEKRIEKFLARVWGE